ncbi:MAG: non-canonical purine NTP diphosphatase [Prevotellaceae bacterium]|jgi:XTP/dITP diphosphohydrolase|nr:non-canonical purine NTP diphosphatase [Prevotellaceae bacterium]
MIFATNNKHKLEEVQAMLGNSVKVAGLSELDFFEEIPETADTLQGNALQKAQFIHQRFDNDCFADDTGLEVDCLNGAPGVFSARYAGEPTNSEKNIDKLLAEMEKSSDRSAQFRTVIALIQGSDIQYFDGIIRGKIATERYGSGGFGYDAVFIPEGYNKTFAELSAEEKNSISHRGRAVKKLVEFLSKQRFLQD